MNAIEILRLIGPMLQMLIEPIISQIPNQILQMKLQQMLDFTSKLDDLGSTLRDAQMTSLQPILVPLRELLDALNVAQNALVEIYNVAADIMALEHTPHRDKPTTVNF
jgi:hypothetical protein